MLKDDDANNKVLQWRWWCEDEDAWLKGYRRWIQHIIHRVKGRVH